MVDGYMSYLASRSYLKNDVWLYVLSYAEFLKFKDSVAKRLVHMRPILALARVYY